MFKYNMFEEYLSELSGYSEENTVSSYRNTLRRFSDEMEIIDAQSMNDLTTGHYRKYALSMASDGYSRGTINLHMRHLFIFLKWLYDYKQISKDAIFEWERIKDKIKKSVRDDSVERPGKLISDEDLHTLLTDKNKSLEESLLMNILYYTGRRREDIATIQIKDIRVCEGYSVIVFPSEKKTKKRSETKLPEYPTKLLEKYLSERLGDGIKELRPELYLFGSYLFIKEAPMTGQSIRNAIIRLENSLGLETHFSPKDFRFTRGHWIFHNIGLDAATNFFRHSSTAITASFYKTENKVTATMASDKVFDADLNTVLF